MFIRSEPTVVRAGYGVDVSQVEVDTERRTGIYFKDPSPTATKVHYFRAGSAAARMSPPFGEAIRTSRARLVHLSGITPALSENCAALMTHLFTSRLSRGPLRSFDVNYRSALWSTDIAAPALLSFARAADVVFVGLDEAQALWGTATEDEVRALLSDVSTLVVKNAGRGATCYAEGTRTHVPAIPVDVVEPVGAGDAFAAGFLSGLLQDWSVRDRLRLGHLVAARTLRSTSDVVALPRTEALQRAVQIEDSDWPHALAARQRHDSPEQGAAS